MAMALEHQHQGLILLSRCMQKPSDWITDRISNGQLTEAIPSFFQTGTSCEPLENTTPEHLEGSTPDPLTELLDLLNSYRSLATGDIRKILSSQYTRWTTVDANTTIAAAPSSPFKEAQDPLQSYRHLPGQEIMEWYHCCGMKMPTRFVGRPDSIHMKLEFAIYLIGNISKDPDDPDHRNTYQVFLQRFFLPHLDRLLAHRCGREQFPFYYMLCALIQSYLT